MFNIYSWVIIAIYKAVEYIYNNEETTKNKYIILSDSLSSLNSVKTTEKSTDIAKSIQELTYKVYGKGKQISFIWVPVHIRMRENERTDQEA